MPIIQAKPRLSAGQLLEAVEQMPAQELERFVAQVIAMSAHHRAPTLSRPESELLMAINQGVPANLQRRYDELIAKRRAVTLTREEHEELLALTEQVEELDLRRAERLVELARLRKTTLSAVMEDLGIGPQPYV